MNHSKAKQLQRSRRSCSVPRVVMTVFIVLLTTSCGRTPETGKSSDDPDTIHDTGVQEDSSALPDTAIGPTDADTSPEDGVGDGPDSGGSSPDSAADAGFKFVLPKICEASDLPKPEETCTKEGELRCTNAGLDEFMQKYQSYPWFGIYSEICYRPNHLRCTSLNGKLVWKIENCSNRQFDKSYNTSDNCSASFWSCIREPSGDRCGPTLVHKKPENPDDPYYTDQELLRLSRQPTKFCHKKHPNPDYRPGATKVCGSGMLLRCQTLAESGVLASKIKQLYGGCAKFLQQGVWLLPVPGTFCPESVSTFDCPPKTCYTGSPGWPNCPGTTLTSCFKDPTQGGQARCRLGCDDRPDKDGK